MRRQLMMLAMLPAFAGAVDKATCPLVLPSETVAIKAPNGWRGYSSSLMRLTGFGMMAGPPESMTYLVPAGEKAAKGQTTTSWDFPGGGEKWLYCTYDGSAAIQISKRLEDGTQRCEVSTKGRRGVIEQLSVQCR